MPDNYYKILGLCCFLKDLLLACASLTFSLRDIKIARFLNNFYLSYDCHYKVEQISIDNPNVFCRTIIIQFPQTIYYNILRIHQNSETGDIWIDINQLSPHTHGGEVVAPWWRFFDMNEPLLKKSGLAPISQCLIRQIVVCKTKK